MATEIFNVVIIGSGPAGSTAAVYTARGGLGPVVLQGAQPGGQLTTTTEIENFPGFENGIGGAELMMIFQKQAERFGADYRSAVVTSVDLACRPFSLETDDGALKARTLIIASGASPRLLGLPDEKRLFSRGFHTCATCDGAFYRGKEVAVIGGGDSAMEEAGFLTRLCEKVRVIHRRDALRASQIMQERTLANPKIEMIWNATVSRILGEPGAVEGVEVKDVKDGSLRTVPASGVFIAIGHVPNTSLFEGQVNLHENGYVATQARSTVTSVPGVFAAGDVADHRYKQAITAAGTGCQAALDCERYLQENPE